MFAHHMLPRMEVFHFTIPHLRHCVVASLCHCDVVSLRHCDVVLTVLGQECHIIDSYTHLPPESVMRARLEANPDVAR